MGLFGKREDKSASAEAISATAPIPGRTIWCGECKTSRAFSKCWKRMGFIIQCPGCGVPFDNLDAIYGKHQPICPRCGEYLEHPGFEYGECDACHSKYELVEGAKPGLLPNKQQRARMEKYGKVWTRE
ncbi:MAG: hypothetical protein AMXMBFR84_18810 [Candidatus Hydrogenedentota bacterium]